MELETIGWIAWLAWFVIQEGAALLNPKRGDTLSEHVWKWFAVAKRNKAAGNQPDGITRLRRFLLLAGMAWLTVHFVGGGEIV